MKQIATPELTDFGDLDWGCLDALIGLLARDRLAARAARHLLEELRDRKARPPEVRSEIAMIFAFSIDPEIRISASRAASSMEAPTMT